MSQTPPTLEDLVVLAERALAAIPDRFTQHARRIGIVVEEIADEQILDDLGLESGYDLTGLYRGTPMSLASNAAPAHEPDMIILYREPILLEWIESGEDLYRLVRNVLVHELAHHFGFSDDDIAALEQD
ncbi:metallopeptidase family protein [Acidisphaera sp. L21]|uniref:metallopeptidase family protein n=1 Tax=Acidisphaera sp. L21 TaxID=1641851 RepID=UPI00131EBCA0|nr:metallopeptidase family protein [Acidisphaera sp. L21]